MLKKTNIKDKTSKTKKECSKEIIITIEFGKFYIYF